MCFQSSYYFELINKEFSLYNEAETNEEKEFWGRNIISRGYYTVLLHCKYVLNITELERYSTDTHKQIISEVINSQVKIFLKSYKKLREYADYYRILKDDLKNEILYKEKLKKFITTISFIIQFDASKLKRKM
ncbi:hypothetical protein ACOL3I_08320 [Aliarcobacter butzleri]